MSDVVELLRNLVSISSVSRESNRGVIDYAASVLEKAGWSFQEYGYLDQAGVEKINLVAWPGKEPPRGGAFHLALVCHTDTVPYAADWTEALVLAEHEGQLHGCGSCDVKGSLACFLAAISAMDAKAIPARVALPLVENDGVPFRGSESRLGKPARDSF